MEIQTGEKTGELACFIFLTRFLCEFILNDVFCFGPASGRTLCALCMKSTKSNVLAPTSAPCAGAVRLSACSATIGSGGKAPRRGSGLKARAVQAHWEAPGVRGIRPDGVRRTFEEPRTENHSLRGFFRVPCFRRSPGLAVSVANAAERAGAGAGNRFRLKKPNL